MNKHEWIDAVVTANLGPRDIAVAAIIYKYYNDKTGKCWPSLATIAGHLNQKKTTGAEASLKSLKRHGFLDWSQGRKGKSNVYAIMKPEPAEAEVEADPLAGLVYPGVHIAPVTDEQIEAFLTESAHLLTDEIPPAEEPDDITYEDVPDWAAEYDAPAFDESEYLTPSEQAAQEAMAPAPVRELVTAGAPAKPWVAANGVSFTDDPPF